MGFRGIFEEDEKERASRRNSLASETMFAFVDETGNTGSNIFDEKQPDFLTAALITRSDFDLVQRGAIAAISRKIGVKDLHGKELGFQRIEPISGTLLKIFKSSNAHFFVSRVEKRYLLATKIFDTLFDSGENAAVAWHHYNLRPLRIILAFKVASIVDYETAQLFWYCLTERNQKKAYARLPEVCEMLMRNVGNLPDARSREIVVDALTWARNHPESIHIHTDRKLVLQGHFPNMVAFSNLLQGLEDFSTRWKRDVRRITHDRQSEFDKTLASWHAMFSNASPEEFRWAGETYKIQKVAGSHFEVKADSDSPGIQAIDVVLWLYSRFKRGDDIPPDCARLLNYVFRRGWESDFSFKGVSAQVEAKWSNILYGPMSDEQADKARELQTIFEQRRLESIRQYSEDGIVPFMRSAEAKLTKPE